MNDLEQALVTEGPKVPVGDRWRSIWSVGWRWGLLALAALAAHGQALRAQFFMDDHFYIDENRFVIEGNPLDIPEEGASPWRGLTRTIFALVVRLSGGVSPVAFHALNLMLHVATVVAVYHTGREILANGRVGRPADRARWVALVGALLFAVHPLGSEGVNYAQNASLQIVTLATVVGVGALWRSLHGRGRHPLAVAAVALWLATFAKEVGFVFTAAALGVTILGVSGWARRWKAARDEVRRHPLLAGGAVLVAAASVVQLLSFYGRALVRSAMSEPLWVPHFFTQGRVFWSYARRFFWPTGLCADHHVPFSGVGWEDPASMWSTIALVGAVGLVIVLILNRPTRRAGMLAALAMLPLVARLFYMNKELFVEYRAYPALPWACLLLAMGLGVVFSRWKVAGAMTVAFLTAAGAWKSEARSTMWGDRYQLAEDIVVQYPTNLRARNQLQKYDSTAGRWPEVMRHAAGCREALMAIEKFNLEAPAGRKFELSLAYRAVVTSEHYHTVALAELYGSKRALEHAAFVVSTISAVNPDFFNPASTDFEVGAPLVGTRRVLERYGNTFDRLKQNPHDPDALRELRELEEKRAMENTVVNPQAGLRKTIPQA